MATVLFIYTTAFSVLEKLEKTSMISKITEANSGDRFSVVDDLICVRIGQGIVQVDILLQISCMHLVFSTLMLNLLVSSQLLPTRVGFIVPPPALLPAAETGLIVSPALFGMGVRTKNFLQHFHVILMRLIQ